MKPLRLISPPTIALVVACVSLAACASPQAPEPQVQIRTVTVPVPVKCSADPGPEPQYADSAQAIAAAPNIFELAKLYAEGRAQRIGRLIELQAANAGCR